MMVLDPDKKVIRCFTERRPRHVFLSLIQLLENNLSICTHSPSLSPSITALSRKTHRIRSNTLVYPCIEDIVDAGLLKYHFS